MTDFPSHASPYISPQPVHPRPRIADLTSTSSPFGSRPTSQPKNEASRIVIGEYDDSAAVSPLHGALISPSLTPPSSARNALPSLFSPGPGSVNRDPISLSGKPPKLLSRLPHVECIVRARIPTTSGSEMFLHLYQNDVDTKEHLAIVFGNTIRSKSLDRVREGETEMDRMIRGAYVGRLRPGRISSRYDEASEPTQKAQDAPTEQPNQKSLSGDCSTERIQAPLVRIHSECYTGETAWSARCDCGEQLDEAARLMSDPSCPGGVIVYLRQEGRGIGLGEKLKAYNLQDLGSDTVEANLLLRHPADARSYGLATAMLVDLGLGIDSGNVGIKLLTNNPDKIRAVEGPNREVIVKERVPMVPLAWSTNGEKGIRSAEIEGYLQTKIGKMGHLLD